MRCCNTLFSYIYIYIYIFFYLNMTTLSIIHSFLCFYYLFISVRFSVYCYVELCWFFWRVFKFVYFFFVVYVWITLGWPLVWFIFTWSRLKASKPLLILVFVSFSLGGLRQWMITNYQIWEGIVSSLFLIVFIVTWYLFLCLNRKHGEQVVGTFRNWKSYFSGHKWVNYHDWMFMKNYGNSGLVCVDFYG